VYKVCSSMGAWHQNTRKADALFECRVFDEARVADLVVNVVSNRFPAHAERIATGSVVLVITDLGR
jgi:hypothetical protein